MTFVLTWYPYLITVAEIRRYEDAKEKALKELEARYEKAVTRVGEDNAEIFNAHAMMLDDEDYNDSIVNSITGQQVNAEYAVATTGDNFSEMFAGMDDEYFKARSVNVKDISERMIRICLTRPEIFKTQLRALFRAGAYGNLSIMYPMITSVKEVLEIKKISQTVREELVA